MANPKRDYIQYRVKKADEAYNDAALLAHNERWNACMNRFYYSSFYLVSALLYQNAIKAQTHKRVKTQFFLYRSRRICKTKSSSYLSNKPEILSKIASTSWQSDAK